MPDIDVTALRAAVETAHDEIVRLCSAREDWRMSIPANLRRDSDLIFDAVLSQIPTLLDRLALAEAAVDRVRSLHDQDTSLLAAGAWCPACGDNEPCRTKQALSEES